MKKNRNSFFTDTNSFNSIGMMQPPINMQGAASFNSFYADNMIPTNYNDYENRFAKIERQINRLEHRINKLESTTSNTYIDDLDNTTNMYML